ncbi:hypothetical protein [Clostridium butyricum]|uniref:hypothetical protein n=1 Tax=Clostridium butyricum TaxID=1492 RepID=UPI00325B60B2
MSKYFVVNDIKVATLMKGILGIDYYKYNNNGREQYTFPRVDGINKAYAQALTIIENL